MGGDLVRVFYSGRDAHNRSSVGTLVLQLSDSPRVLDVAAAPVLVPGTRGAFDDAGVSVASLVPHPEGDRLYYLGWNVGGSLPWRNAIGVAVGRMDTGEFTRFSTGPLMDRSVLDPFGLSYPCVLSLGAEDWRMWYGTTLAWNVEAGDGEHALRSARSADGLVWTRDADLLLRPGPGEYGMTRPSVVQERRAWEMWFGVRGAGQYRLGYARSSDGDSWTRDDTACGLEPETEGWEGGALTYPSVFEAVGRRWMLYNGAGFGLTGMGLAVWEP